MGGSGHSKCYPTKIKEVGMWQTFSVLAMLKGGTQSFDIVLRIDTSGGGVNLLVLSFIRYG